EILIGQRTYELVRDFVEVEELEPLELKGKAEPVPAYHLLSVREGEVLARHHERQMVGREQELDVLQSAFAATGQGHARLATVVGEAGMGKSRLAEEFISSVERQARVVRGRCLPYGRGITFWPLVEIICEAASIGVDDAPELGWGKLTWLGGESDL